MTCQHCSCCSTNFELVLYKTSDTAGCVLVCIQYLIAEQNTQNDIAFPAATAVVFIYDFVSDFFPSWVHGVDRRTTLVGFA